MPHDRKIKQFYSATLYLKRTSLLLLYYSKSKLMILSSSFLAISLSKYFLICSFIHSFIFHKLFIYIIYLVIHNTQYSFIYFLFLTTYLSSPQLSNTSQSVWSILLFIHYGIIYKDAITIRTCVVNLRLNVHHVPESSWNHPPFPWNLHILSPGLSSFIFDYILYSRCKHVLLN